MVHRRYIQMYLDKRFYFLYNMEYKMKKIQLTQDKYALVDEEDFDELDKYKWHTMKSKNTFYAVRKIWNKADKIGKTIGIHRVIMSPPDDKLVDHEDGNGLNNCKYNLRICNYKQNAGNSKLHKHNKSGIRGVCWHKNRNKWVASIQINNKQKHLGIFTDINCAKNAYNKAAKEHFGSFYSEGVVSGA